MIKKLVARLNKISIVRSYVLIPLLFIREKIRDFCNYSFIYNKKKRLKKYRNRYKGKRCFVIGNGPSLMADDLDKIANEYSFASNRIYDIYPYTKWRPTFYGIQDLYVLEEIKSEIESLEKGSKKRFIIGNRRKVLGNDIINDPKNEFFYLGTSLSTKRELKFSNDCSRIIAHGRTITYTLIQLAAYMGFQDIFLIGVDHNYTPFFDRNGNLIKDADKQNHFKGSKPYKKLKKTVISDAGEDVLFMSTKAYQKAEEYSNMHSFHIYNATRGGKLKIFKRVDLNDIINKSVNHE